ncbi:MAG: hypothetical protein FOGNACKC_03457 [Anaerolineae bacterium]|nr:hypothetical protein [Anaerolineae bacterium]
MKESARPRKKSGPPCIFGFTTGLNTYVDEKRLRPPAKMNPQPLTTPRQKKPEKEKYTAMTPKKRKSDALKQLSDQAQRRIEAAKTDELWTKHFKIQFEIDKLRNGGE